MRANAFVGNIIAGRHAAGQEVVIGRFGAFG
jgi:hypothetical protein